MANTRAVRRILTATMISFVLVACGGGGGGSSNSAGTAGGGTSSGGSGAGSGGSTAGPSANIPLDPPAAPTIDFQGNGESAELDDVSTAALADGIHLGLFLGLSLADESSDIDLPAGGVDESFPGPDGGTVAVTGRLNDDHTGWVQYDLDDFTEGDATWNGRQVFVRLQVNNGLQDSLTEVRLVDFSFRSDGRDITFNGSIMHRSSISPRSSTVTGSVMFADNLAGTEFLAENISLFRNEVSGGYELGGTGRIYDGVHGWLDIEFVRPWGVRPDEFFPVYGGPVIGRTANGKELRIVSLTPSMVSVQYASASSPLPDRAALLEWPETFAAQTSRISTGSPWSDAGPSLYAQPGTSVVLNGAFSLHPQRSFMNHEWKLVFRPPGSSAAIDDRYAVRPSVEIDVPGRYLVELEVSDGKRSDRDFVLLTADDDTDPGFPLVEAQLPRARSAALGETVQVDKLTTLIDFHGVAPGVNVRVNAPSGDTAGVSQDEEKATFLADEEGGYVVVLYQGVSSLFGNHPRDFQTIDVGLERLFAPAVTFPVLDDPARVTMADLDGDGLSDLVASHALPGGGGQVDIYYAGDGPSFHLPVSVASGEGGSVVVGDVSSDGRLDIVTGLAGGVMTLVQQPDGTFSAGSVYPGGCLGGRVQRSVIIADANNDGRNDVIADGTCSREVEMFAQAADGSLAGVVAIVSPGTHANLAAGDLNGDGLVDLAVGAENDQTGNGNYSIFYGTPGGTIPAPEHIPVSVRNRNGPAIGIGDLNNDGRDDLIFTVAQNFPLLRQMHIHHQADDGSLAEAQVVDIGSEVLFVQLHDIDRDGLVDIVPSLLGYWLQAYLQQDDNSFGEQPVRFAAEFENARRIPPEALGDVNGDGLTDLAFANGAAELVLMLGTD